MQDNTPQHCRWTPNSVRCWAVRGFGAVAISTALLASPAHAQYDSLAKQHIAPRVDHHIHLGSDALRQQMEEMQKQDPTAFQHLSKDIFSKPTLSDALRNLDEAGVKQAVLLSTAYWFALPGQSAKPSEAARKMREENRFNVDTAMASHGRLSAFIAINPFAPNARDELKYWRGKPGVSGIKLHLGAAGFRETSRLQVAKLATFFADAKAENLPLVVHLRGGGSFTKNDVRIFVAKVLSRAGDLPVQIAHGGGYGGGDPATIDALSTFGEAIARHAPGTKNLVFDISGVVLPEATAEALGTSDAQLVIFVGLMRKIGLDRFIVGSDWPAIGAVAPYYALVRQKLPVTDDEWAQLCANVAPYLKDRRK